jgi:hypothetical protein
MQVRLGIFLQGIPCLKGNKQDEKEKCRFSHKAYHIGIIHGTRIKVPFLLMVTENPALQLAVP